MIDIVNLLPEVAARLGIAPSSLLFWITVIVTAANALARRIPDDATGVLGAVRTVAGIIGVKVESRLTADATVADVAKAALKTPPITQKVAAERVEP